MVADPGDTLTTLPANYESMGYAAIRAIHLESEIKIAGNIGEKARKALRDWCRRMFEP